MHPNVERKHRVLKMEYRSEVLKYLSDMQLFWLSYQNHKELCAWAGILLFAAFLAAITAAIDRHRILRVSWKLIWSGASVASAFVLFAYVHQQFHLRREAANYVAASSWLRAEILSHPDQPIDPTLLAPPEKGDEELTSTHWLARSILQKANEMSSRGQEARRTLEWRTYAVGMVMLGAVILRILASGRIYGAGDDAQHNPHGDDVLPQVGSDGEHPIGEKSPERGRDRHNGKGFAQVANKRIRKERSPRSSLR